MEWTMFEGLPITIMIANMEIFHVMSRPFSPATWNQNSAASIEYPNIKDNYGIIFAYMSAYAFRIVINRFPCPELRGDF